MLGHNIFIRVIIMISSTGLYSFILFITRKREFNYARFPQTASSAVSIFLAKAAIILLVVFFAAPLQAGEEKEEKLYSLNVYGGKLTTNNWEDFFGFGKKLNFENSYFTAVAVSRLIGRYEKKASFEIEGQVVRHFNWQNHWEINALVTARWESFFWDKYVDTSIAFGLGPSFATAEPEIEILTDGSTSRFLIYWMLELALGLPEYPNIAFITRLHHRSGGFGLINDKGGSNALAIGIKYKF